MDLQSLGSPIAKGRTAEVYAWQDGQVVKLYYDSIPSSWLTHEVMVTRLISAMDLPVPRFLGECTVSGRPGMLFERVEGVTMLAQLGSTPWRVAHFARMLAEVQYHLHQHQGQGLPILRSRLERSIMAAKPIPENLRSASLKYLESLPDGSTLCHFDLHPEQVMISSSGPVVIDWTNAAQGDPMADLTRTMLMLTIGDPVDNNSWVLGLLLRMARNTFYRTYLHRYLQLNPAASKDKIAAWMPVVAAARLNENIADEQGKLLRIVDKGTRPKT